MYETDRIENLLAENNRLQEQQNGLIGGVLFVISLPIVIAILTRHFAAIIVFGGFALVFWMIAFVIYSAVVSHKVAADEKIRTVFWTRDVGLSKATLKRFSRDASASAAFLVPVEAWLKANAIGGYSISYLGVQFKRAADAATFRTHCREVVY